MGCRTPLLVMIISLVLSYLYGIAAAESFIIQRVVKQGGDVFKLASKVKCSNFCGQHKATAVPSLLGCACQCRTKPNFTFSLTDNGWSCLNDSKVRAKEGCSVFMGRNTRQSEIVTLADGHGKELNLFFLANCYINHDNSYYLTCNGTWEKTGPLLYQRFYLLPSGKSPWKLELKVQKMNKATSFLNGRVIKLGFTKQCHLTAGTSLIQPCLLLKLQGNTKCGTNTPAVEATPARPVTPVRPVTPIKRGSPEKPVLVNSTSISKVPTIPQEDKKTKTFSMFLPSSATPSLSTFSSFHEGSVSISSESGFQSTSSLPFARGNSELVSMTTSHLGRERSLISSEIDIIRNGNKDRRQPEHSNSLGESTIIILAGIVSAAATVIIVIIAVAIIATRRKSRAKAVTRECETDEDGYIMPCDGWKAAVNRGKTNKCDRRVISNSSAGDTQAMNNLAYDASNNDLWTYARRQLPVRAAEAPRRNTGLVYDYALPEMPMKYMPGVKINKEYDRKLNNRPKPPPVQYKRNVREHNPDPVYCDIDRTNKNSFGKKRLNQKDVDKSSCGCGSNTANNNNRGSELGTSKHHIYHEIEKVVNNSEDVTENETEI